MLGMKDVYYCCYKYKVVKRGWLKETLKYIFLKELREIFSEKLMLHETTTFV